MIIIMMMIVCDEAVFTRLLDSDGVALGHRNHQSTVSQLRTLAECDARAMESAARAMQEAMVKRIEEASSRVAAAAAAAANSQVPYRRLESYLIRRVLYDRNP